MMEKIPGIEEPKIKWTKLVRKFLSLKKDFFLEKAIAEAKQLKEPGIYGLLQAFADENIAELNGLAERLVPELKQAGRVEESLTVKLLYLDTRVNLLETYVNYLDEEQKQVREIGIQACTQAIQVSLKLVDQPCEASYLDALGIYFAKSRQFRKAEDFFSQALRIRRALAAREPQIFKRDVADSLHNLGILRGEMKMPTEAEKFYSEALCLYQELAVREPQIFNPFVAETFHELGVMKSDMRELVDAEKYYKDALQVFRLLAVREPDVFNRDVAATLTNLASVQSDMRRLAEAEDSYVKALELNRKSGTQEWLATALNGLGALQKEQKKFAEAEMSYVEALRIRRDLTAREPDDFNQDVAETLHNLGLIQSETGKFADAEKSYTEALRIKRDLAAREPHIFNRNLAMTLDNLGIVQVFLKKFGEAEESCAEALQIRRDLALEEPDIFNRFLAMSLHNTGVLQAVVKKFTASVKSYEESLRIRRKLAAREPHIFNRSVAMTLDALGTSQMGLKKLENAEKYYREALYYYQDLALHEPSIFNQNVASTRNNIGNLQLEQKQFGKARKNFEFAKNLIEDLRAKAVSIDDRRRILQENSKIYNSLLECYIRIKNRKKALEIAELGKSRSLSDLLNLKVEDLLPKAPSVESLPFVRKLGLEYSEIIKQLQQIESYERYLTEQLTKFENDIDLIKDKTVRDEEKRQSLLLELTGQMRFLEDEKRKKQEQRLTAQSELQKVLEEINEYDKDFPPKAKNIDAGNIIDISKKENRTIVIFRFLRQFTALIFIFPDQRLHIETVQNFGSNDLFKLFYDDWLIPYYNWKKGHKVPDLKEAFWEGSSANDSADWFFLMEKTLADLYEKLMIHVRRILHGKSPTRELLLIPSQSLSVLPLHAASWKDESGKNHYLLEEFTISYCPSVSVFKRCQKNETERTGKTLIITDPKSNLIFSENEVRSIKKIHRSNKDLRGKRATKSAVIEALAQEDYGFLHFACHGFYSKENPFDSGLELADEVIKLSEIISCNLQNNWLTVLSACETGIVDFDSPTDEHFGLPLGFIFAGSPSVWASLWSVSDETTSLLMREAYENLNKTELRKNKPEALRQAQLSIRETFSHPFYWAGFQHFGI